MIDITGLVLSVQDHKERNGIVYVLLEDRIQSVYARGIQSPASKNRRLCNPFSDVTLIVSEQKSSTMDNLIKGNVNKYYHHIQDDLVAQSVCFVLRDCLFRVHIVPEYQALLKKVWENFSDKVSNMNYACILMGQILKNEGIAPDVSACVSCGSKQKIETVSWSGGGFLCVGCNQGQYPKWPKEDLEKLRNILVVKDDLIDVFAQHASYDLDDFLFLAKWFEYFENVELPSVRFLSSIRTLGQGKA